MPRKKCNKNDKHKDELLLMKTIKSRLIKISMKVDNYIYKQKTISITQAKTFLDEISSYKPQSDGNAQCLQVIEKLTIFMNFIISDEDSIIDNSTNKVNNSIEVETTHDEAEIRNITSPVSEVANKNDTNEYLIPNENNQCDLPNLSKECNKNLLYSNKNENINMEVEEAVTTENTTTNIHNSQANSTRDINVDKTLGITSIGPLDLRKPVHNRPTLYSQEQIISNKTTENNTTLKHVVKTGKPETAIKCEVLQKFNQLKINKAANIQDKTNNKEPYNKCMNNEYVNSKTNVKFLQDQPLKTVATEEYMQSSDSSIIFNPQYIMAESSKNVLNVAERIPKETSRKNETKPDISTQYCTQNVITKNNEDDERKNLLVKPKNKRKTNKQSDMKEKIIKTDVNKPKKVKRVNKSRETRNAKKSNPKHVKNNINLDLSWFDNIKFIRQVDEQEYFTEKHSNRF